MGFFLTVQAGDEAGQLMTRLPTRGGNAVLILLTALGAYCMTSEDERTKDDYKLFKQFEIYLEHPICDVFEPIMHCIWSEDGGIGGDFQEDEYEWYLKRNAMLATKMTEAEFRQFVRASTTHWSLIDSVAANVKLLVDLFNNPKFSQLDEFYLAEHMLPGLKALQNTLGILKSADFDTVRLNFI